MAPIYNIQPLINTVKAPAVTPLSAAVGNVGFVNENFVQTSDTAFVGNNPLSLSGNQIKALAENNPRIMQLMDEMNVWNYS